jgi:hypothetical protein
MGDDNSRVNLQKLYAGQGSITTIIDFWAITRYAMDLPGRECGSEKSFKGTIFR